MKIAVITDSNSGITQKQGEELGIYIVPMPFFINEEEFLEDINLSQEEFYTRLDEGSDIGTSQPAIGGILDLWDRLLEEYDEIVHIPMSSELSGSCESAAGLAQDYDGKVQVVNNQRISVIQKQSVFDAKALAEKGKTAREIKEILEREKYESSIYLVVDTLKYLKKGGRITAAAAAIGTVLNLKPVLQIQGGKLDAYSKARGVKQAKKIMEKAMVKDLSERFGEAYENHRIHLHIAHSANQEIAEEFKKEMETVFPGIDINVDGLSLSVACHVGPGALALACSLVPKELA